MSTVMLGGNRVLAIALSLDGAVIAFGSSTGRSYADAEERFADALEEAAPRLARYRVLVETNPSWDGFTRRVKWTDIQNVAFIINA